MERPARRRRGAARSPAGLSRSEIKQKIRALKKERATANARAAKSKVAEFNLQLRVYRRLLRRVARRST